MASNIYTKTGDKGETSLFGGKRLPKDDIRIEAYGTVDELNAHIAWLKDSLLQTDQKLLLKSIQDNLFSIGSILASDPRKNYPLPEIRRSDVLILEEEIDAMTSKLPKLKHFILPGGHPTVSVCHVARCVCRRAERRIVSLNRLEEVPAILIEYMNRLSDYLFVYSRWIGQELGAEEIKWTPRDS
ncbi:MAG: cob(I)yrinic acid a,c-diamide adenosyltransferase [Bacteroidetes bacterium]|nr:cob(I)yrinic acid a,c-diamide adenosyltransferase [Bacteroidota bacterium]